MTQRHLIGTSLSGCIHDIMEGTVSEAEVLVIVTNTMHPFEDNPDHVFDNRRWESKESKLIDRLWKEGRIHQPRKVSRWYENNVENCALDPEDPLCPTHVFPREDYMYRDHWYTISLYETDFHKRNGVCDNSMTMKIVHPKM